MALQIWLPLTKDTRNQGLCGDALTESGINFSDGGKLGGKYLSAGTITIPAATSKKIFNKNNMSFAFWLYPIGTSGSSPIMGQQAMSTGDNRMYTLFQYSTPNDLHLSWQDNTATNSAVFLGGVWNGFFPANTWTHCCVTYNGSKATIYRNGVEYDSSSGTSNRTSFEYNFPIFGASIRRLQDVRIYDHCLSPMEVKELSKGLVLHYPLSDRFLESTTNLVTSITSGGQTTWTNNILTTSGTNADTYFTINLSESIVNGTQYTISCDAKDIPQGTCWTFPLGQQGNTALSFQIYNGHNEYTFTANNISWGTNRCFMDDGGSPNSARATGAQCKIYNFQIEKKDHATGFAGYGGTRNSNTVYDCSGFCNNGIIYDTTIQIIPNNIKYAASLKNSQAYNSYWYPFKGFLALSDIDKMTVTFWAKPTSIGHQDSGIFSTTANDIPTDYQATAMNHYDGVIACTNTSGKVANLGVSNQFTLNEWHHYCIIYDGTKVWFYKDGISKTSVAQTGKLKPFTSIFPFYSCAGGANRTTSGNLSDLRIYATALSADDVKSLYQNEARIDSSGTIYGKIHN